MQNNKNYPKFHRIFMWIIKTQPINNNNNNKKKTQNTLKEKNLLLCLFKSYSCFFVYYYVDYMSEKKECALCENVKNITCLQPEHQVKSNTWNVGHYMASNHIY